MIRTKIVVRIILLTLASYPAAAKPPADPICPPNMASAAADQIHTAAVRVAQTFMSGQTPADWAANYHVMLARSRVLVTLCGRGRDLGPFTPYTAGPPLTCSGDKPCEAAWLSEAPIRVLRWLSRDKTLLDPRVRTLKRGRRGAR